MRGIPENKARKSSEFILRHFKAAYILEGENLEEAAKKLHYASSSPLHRIMRHGSLEANDRVQKNIIGYICASYSKHVGSHYIEEQLVDNFNILFSYKQQFRKKAIK